MTPDPPHAPGSWLRRFARLIFDDDTMMRVVDPTLADLEHEVREAGDDDAARRAARLRGHFAFWKLVALSPFVFADWPGRRQFAQSLTHISAIVVLLVVTFSAQSDWMTRLLVKFHELYPQVTPRILSAADLGPYVWMLTPIAVAMIAAFGRRSPFRVAPSAVVMLCGATITAAAAYGAAGFVAGFERIGVSGSAGIKAVIPAIDALAIPSLLALGMAGVTAIVVSVSQWRARDVMAPGTGPATGSPATVVLAVSMAASLVAMNQWLLLNEELLDAALALTNNDRFAAAGGFKAVLGRTDIAIPLMILGFVIAVTTLATAFAAWRGSRTRRPSRLLLWSTRLAVAGLLLGSVWHASVIAGQWQIFRTETAHLRSLD
jgi:hypothetical protein